MSEGICTTCNVPLLSGQGDICGRCAVKNYIRKIIAKKSEGPIMDYVKKYAPQFADEAADLVIDSPDKTTGLRSTNEADPNGIDQHAPGAKLDAGKLKASLVLGDFSRALTEVIRVGTFGANKYTDHGWLAVPDGVNRYSDAMQRHYLKEQSGEQLDADSGLVHASHLAWNALARLELMLRGPK